MPGVAQERAIMSTVGYMKFDLVDRIVELVPGRSIRTVKSLTLSEEYLADHFRTFPVMPGVLMLESMAQSAGWLVRVSQDFARSLVLLVGAKNVSYKNFITPGQVLTLELECKSLNPDRSEFLGRGFCGQSEMVKARITLDHINLADRNPSLESVDHELIAHARMKFALIGGQACISTAAIPFSD